MLRNSTKSVQVVETPLTFIAAVTRRFGVPSFDLAANERNHKASRWYGPGGEAEDSLVASWDLRGLLWLNPPYNQIAPFAHKSIGRHVAFLVPASVGSNWYRDYVAPFAMVHFLNGRLVFGGSVDPYPADLMLAIYGVPAGTCVWDWYNDRISSVSVLTS